MTDWNTRQTPGYQSKKRLPIVVVTSQPLVPSINCWLLYKYFFLPLPLPLFSSLLHLLRLLSLPLLLSCRVTDLQNQVFPQNTLQQIIHSSSHKDESFWTDQCIWSRVFHNWGNWGPASHMVHSTQNYGLESRSSVWGRGNSTFIPFPYLSLPTLNLY